MSEENQLELPLPEEDDDKLYVENLTLTPDTMLAGCMGKFKRVFVIGVDDDGFSYSASSSDTYFWTYALERAKQFIMNYDN